MQAVMKTITYLLDDLNDIEKEIKKEWDNGWRASNRIFTERSYLDQRRKEIQITYYLHGF